MSFWRSKSKFGPGESAQSLIETALVIPLILLLTFNAINFAYYLFVAINLASAPRQGVEYSIQGFATPGTLSLPAAGPETTATTVSWLTYKDMEGLNLSANAEVQVCTKLMGLAAAGQPNCTKYPSTAASFPTPDADPEPSVFVLHRVDVRYTVTPLIPTGMRLFGFNLFAIPSLTFHRQVSMRAMD